MEPVRAHFHKRTVDGEVRHMYQTDWLEAGPRV